MKAYKVSDRKGYSDYSVVVFADTPGKAVCLALGTDEFPSYDVDFMELKARRIPKLDAFYRGNWYMDWDNMEDRVALVKEANYMCDPYYAALEDCENCPATEWCEQYERMKDDAEWSDLDHCYECRGLGDDYEIDGDNLVSRCDTCPFNPNRRDD